MAPTDLICEFIVMSVVVFLGNPTDYTAVEECREFKAAMIKHLRRAHQHLPLLWAPTPNGGLVRISSSLGQQGILMGRDLHPTVVLKGHLFTSLVGRLQAMQHDPPNFMGLHSIYHSVPGIHVVGALACRYPKPFVRFFTMTVQLPQESFVNLWVGILKVDGNQYYVQGRLKSSNNTLVVTSLQPPTSIVHLFNPFEALIKEFARELYALEQLQWYGYFASNFRMLISELES